MYSLPPPLALREVRASDREFLELLYASSRDDLTSSGLDATVLKPLLQMQQRVQEQGFTDSYPKAWRLVLEKHGEPIGRAVVDVGATDIRLVDIAVLPFARRAGAARALVQALQVAARDQSLSVSLAVSRTNLAAKSLYVAQGFQVTSFDEVFEQMTWKVASS